MKIHGEERTRCCRFFWPESNGFLSDDSANMFLPAVGLSRGEGVGFSTGNTAGLIPEEFDPAIKLPVDSADVFIERLGAITILNLTRT